MRTTLTLDDDVAAVLERLRKSGRRSLKALVNEALRAGLKLMTATPKSRRPYRTRPADLGPCALPDLDNVAEVLAVAEGEAYR
jgi:hypothetical protein